VSEREELHTLLAERAFRWGDFTLASGRRSNFFFDGKQVTLEGRGLLLVAQLMLDRCVELGVSAVGGDDGVGPILGAITAISAVDPDADPLTAFMVRKVMKDHGITARVAGPALQPGQRVAVIDDVITTGGSVFRAVDALAGTGVVVAEVLVIVDREEGGEAALAERGLRLFPLFRRSQFSAPAEV
jgi:orotate phosphoribosyltransferase